MTNTEMKVEHIEGYIALHEFPAIFQHFLNGNGTLDIQCNWRQIARDNETHKAEVVIPFMDRVFEWGGETGACVRDNLYTRELSKNHIARTMSRSFQFLQERKLEDAIEEITSLGGLGMSYGSKMLRMMSPQQAVTYDRLLQGFFTYPVTPEGYAEFCTDCRKLADMLHEQGIRSPCHKSGKWDAADVEATIFHGLRCKRYI